VFDYERIAVVFVCLVYFLISFVLKILEGDKETGELLISGGMNWDLTGRKQLPKTG